MKVLVTGVAGFLGFHLARSLALRPGCEVTGVDSFVRGEDDHHFHRFTAQRNVTFIRVDLNDAAEVGRLQTDFDYIYHFAALNGTQNFYEAPFEVLKCCTLPTLYTMELAGRTSNLRRFVYAGTSESYASTVTHFNWPFPTDETVPLGIDDVFNPRWSYAASKLHGEVVTAQGGRQFGVPISIIRFHNAYGPRMGDKHVIPDFYRRARAGRLELYGHKDTRSFIYVDDAVRASVMVAESERCAGEVVNIGGEREIVIADLARDMMAAAGLSGEIELHDAPKGSVSRRVPDLRKLKRLTGYASRVGLADGLRLTSRFYFDDVLPDACLLDED